ncbi:lipoyl synthase [Botrimarina mediterranea]|uniref:Lipoyl synthase n=1 Tax=Botrimarina mediterranea TaxID=2528022 RepID=A0A518K5B2_9BACT|nr:lipoyl synthase [Botrimarina mediterranea]QDV72976.1 Lipoyl synthase [Botrimarina mediterranea]QDV77550.1 Lipoyl synthase [Planctomycetes bacterium K2D]
MSTVPARETKTNRPRLPQWLRSELPSGDALRLFNRTQGAVDGNALHTVCEEARCPNIHDCWGRGTATFMVAGKECTRGCRFCSVQTLRAPAPPDVDEPEHLADAVQRMGLKYVVITVVNRDDMPDGGASHYRACVEAIHQRDPNIGIELLGSDLAGNLASLQLLLGGSGPSSLVPSPSSLPLSVFAHNVECAPRLDKQVRDPRASFDQSLTILREAKRLRPDLATKSSLMVGLGETDDEVRDAMRRLREEAGVDIVTLGQYLTPGRPGERYLPVDRYVTPEQFDRYRDQAYEMGFAGVASGPMVRSSFRAGVLYEATRTGRRVEDLLSAEEPDVVQVQLAADGRR